MYSSLPHFDRSSYEEPSYEEGFEETVKVNFVPKFKDDCVKELYMQFLYWLLLERNELKISTNVRSFRFGIMRSVIQLKESWIQLTIRIRNLLGSGIHSGYLGLVLSLDELLYMFITQVTEYISNVVSLRNGILLRTSSVYVRCKL